MIRFYTVFFKIFFCLLVFTGFIWSTVPRETYTFERMPLGDKFANFHVYDITQDNYGYLWIGTSKGIYYFDGHEFKKIYPESKSTDLKKGTIFKLHVDENNMLWIFTKYFIKNYNIKTNKFNTIISKNFGFLWGITRGNADTLYVAYQSKNKRTVYILTLSNKKIFLHSDLNNFINRNAGLNIKDIYYRNGRLFIATSIGLHVYNTRSHKFTKLNDLYGQDIATDPKGNIWTCGFSNTVFRCNPQTNALKKYLIYPENPDVKISTMACWDNHRIWLASRGKEAESLSLYNTETGQLLSANKLTGTAKINVLTEVLTFYIDKEKTVWIGTIQLGLYKLTQKNRFFNFNEVGKEPDKLSDRYIFSMCSDRQGCVWMGTRTGGLIRYNPDRGTFKHYKHDPNNPHSISGNKVHDIFESQNRRFWINTYYSLEQFDPLNQSFKHWLFHNKPFSDSKNPIKTYKSGMIINQDKNRKMWFGGSDGFLYTFNKKENKVIKYSYANVNKEITSICEDSLNIFWIGTYGDGLKIFDRVKRKYIRSYNHDDQNPNSISSDYITTIFCNSKDHLWIGTENGGLNKFDYENNTFVSYSVQDGLVCNQVYGIVEDKYNNLWIATAAGLSRFEPKTESFTNYTAADGVKYYLRINDNFNLHESEAQIRFPDVNKGKKKAEIIKTTDNRIYVASINGFTCFDPQDFYMEVAPPNIILTGMSIAGRDTTLDIAFPEVEKIKLSYRDDMVTFKYAITDYKAPQEHKFAYFLEGHQQNWHYAGKQHIITYSNIEPGHYVMHAKGADHWGNWNEVGCSFQLIVAPPFWQTTLFYVAVIIFISGVTFIVFRLRLRSIRSQKQLLEEKVANQTWELLKARDHLEVTVQVRTRELIEANEELKQEIEARQTVQQALKKSKQRLAVNLSQQELLADISIIFNSLDNFDDKINKTLHLLGKNMKISQVCIFENRDHGTLISNTHEWCATGVTPLKQKLQAIPIKQIPSVKNMIQEKGLICCQTVDSFPADIRKYLKPLGIRSLLILPVYSGKTYFGFIGFCDVKQERDWNIAEINLLKTISYIISKAFEKRKMEKNLEYNEQAFRTLINAPNELALLIDLDTTILAVNDAMCKSLNKTKDELLGKPIGNFLPADLIKQRYKQLQKCIKTKTAVYSEDSHDGSFFANSVFPVLDLNNEIASIAVFSRDITKQKEAEQIIKRDQEELKNLIKARTHELEKTNMRLKQEIQQRQSAEKELILSEKEKRENLRKLTLQLAHEIKNPLASIKSSAQLVESLEKQKGHDTTLNHMNVITRNVDICNRVIRELYNYTHQSDLDLAPVKMKQMVNQIENYAKEKAGHKKGISVVIKEQLPAVQIKADIFKLIQAFKNIIDNAMDAIKGPGEVRINTQLIGESRVLIEIIDTGEGISDEVIHKIYEPFYTNKTAGFGLGLSIVKEIIEGHQGTITTHSELCRGTIIRVEFPVLTATSNE